MLRFCEWEPGEDIHGGKPVLLLGYRVSEANVEADGVWAVMRGTFPVYDIQTEMNVIQCSACLVFYRRQFKVNQAFQARCLSACTSDYLKQCEAAEERFCRN